MNSKRSMWQLFVGVAGVSLLVTNCTLKTDADDDNGGGSSNSNAGANNNAGATSTAGAGNTTSGDCSPVGKKINGCLCAGNVVSYQLCTSDGVYGACVCADTSNGGNSSGGASSYAGEAGARTAAASNGDAGACGDANVVYATCSDCLADRCKAEYDACDADPDCICAEVSTDWLRSRC